MHHKVVFIIAFATSAFSGLGVVCAQEIAQGDSSVESQPALSTSGSFFSRYELRRGYAQAPVIGDEPASDLFRYRARFGLHVDRLTTEPVELGVHFVPQAGGFWHVGGDELADPVLGLHEAWIDIARPGFRIDVGRFEMAYGDHLVIGNVGWHHLGRAFDGLRGHFEAGDAWFDVFFTVLNEGFVQGPFAEPYGASDTYFAGAYAGLGELIWEKLDLDLYLLSRIWPGVENLPDDPDLEVIEQDPAADVTAGVRLKGRAGVIDFRAEQGLQGGTRPGGTVEAARDVFAYQGDVELGLDLRETLPLRVSGEAFYASGDDPNTFEIEAYDQLYPTGHKWMGLMDVVGARSNVYGGVLHGQVFLTPVILSVDAHAFWRPEPVVGTDEFLGTELNAGAAWTIAGPLVVRGLYGVFVPDAADALHFVEVEARVTF